MNADRHRPTDPSEAGATIEQLASRSGARFVVAHDAGPATVRSVVMQEPDSQQRVPAGAIVLALGFRADEQQFDQLVADAASAGAVAIIAKPSTADQTRLRELGEKHAISTVLVTQATDWLRLASTLHSAAAVSTVDTVAGIRVGDLFAFANAVALATGAATAIVDPAGRLLSFSNLPDQPLDELRRRATLLMAEPDSPAHDADYQRLYRAAHAIHVPGAAAGDYDRVAIAVRSHGEILGSIWVLVPPGASRRRTVEALTALAEPAAVHLHHARADLDLERMRHTGLLQAVLREEDARDAYRSLGLADKAWFRLAVFVPSSPDALDLSRRQVQSISDWLSIVQSQALFAELDARLVVLFSGTETSAWEPVERALSHLVQTSDSLRDTVVIATSGPAFEASGIRDEYDRLRTLAALLERHEVAPVAPSRTVRMEDHWAHVELVALATAYGAGAAAGRSVALLDAVRAYDRENRSDYWSTLVAFVANDRRYADTASEMHVHVNTVRYRIERLRATFGLDLGDRFTFLWVAVQLLGPAASSGGRAR